MPLVNGRAMVKTFKLGVSQGTSLFVAMRTEMLVCTMMTFTDARTFVEIATDSHLGTLCCYELSIMHCQL